ncbi:hypothetical protein [Neisseria dumasiana]|nr:hypothetical protein [Neisseria dumasiana]
MPLAVQGAGGGKGGVLHVYRCGRLKTGLAGLAEILFNPLSDGL